MNQLRIQKMAHNKLEAIFNEALHVTRPASKKPAAPIDPLVKLQKALDALTGTGAERCDLSKAATKTPARKTVVMKETEKRDYAFHKATRDESFGTRSHREIAGGNNIAKAAREDAIVLHGGFTSRADLTGKT